MASTDRSVNILIKARDQASAVFAGVGKSGDKLVQSLSSIKGALAGGLGFVGLSMGIREAVQAYATQQEAEARVRQALAATGQEVDSTLAAMKRYASELQSITTLGDESALAIQATAIAAGATVPQAQRLTRAAVDMGAALGRDVNESARQLTKTLGGMAGELGELVPELRTLTREQLQAGAAIDLIAKKFEGAGKAAGSYSRMMQQIRNSVGDLGETLVGSVARSVAGEGEAALNWLAQVRDAIDDVSGGLDAIQKALPQADPFAGVKNQPGILAARAAQKYVLSPTGEAIGAGIINTFGQDEQDREIAKLRRAARDRASRRVKAEIDDIMLSGAEANMAAQSRYGFARNFMRDADPLTVSPMAVAKTQAQAMSGAFESAIPMLTRARAALAELNAQAAAAVQRGVRFTATLTSQNILAEARQQLLELRADGGDAEAQRELELLRIREQHAAVEQRLLGIVRDQSVAQSEREQAERGLLDLRRSRLAAEDRIGGAGERRASDPMRRALAPLVEGLGTLGIGASFRQQGPINKLERHAEKTARNSDKQTELLQNISRRFNTGTELAIGVIS